MASGLAPPLPKCMKKDVSQLSYSRPTGHKPATSGKKLRSGTVFSKCGFPSTSYLSSYVDANEDQLKWTDQCNYSKTDEDHTTSVNRTNEDTMLGERLGLDQGFVDWLDNIGDCREHQTDEEWVVSFLNENAEDCEMTDNDNDMLKAFGFREEKAQEILNWLHKFSDDMKGHSTLLEWSLRYMKDELQGPHKTDYPFDEHSTETWHQITFRIRDEREMKKDVNPHCINIPRYRNKTYVNSEYTRYLPKTNRHDLLLYHGTTHGSAESILNNGLSRNHGHSNKDFSNIRDKGVYLSTEFKFAYEWVKNRQKSAVLVYKVPVEKLEADYRLLSISEEEDWRGFVKFNQTFQDARWYRCCDRIGV